MSAELAEALESPLAATRFGVVDLLRERLTGGDLGLAPRGVETLRRLVHDDSRRVALAAAEALEEGVPRVTPAALDLGTTGEGVARLEGSPIALTAVASSNAEWLRVEQDGATIRVRAEAGPGVRVASVILSGPTGEWTIPVHDTRTEAAVAVAELTMPDTESEPPPPPPEPEPEPPQPAPTPEPPHAEPHIEQPTEKTPWWLIAVLVVGAAILIYLNWPGATGSRELWDDELTTSWYVDRSWTDPIFLSSVIALVAGLVARWVGPIALGIVAGCALSVIEDGLLILGGGISDDETTYWLAATAVAVVMVVVLLLVLRPWGWRVWPVPPPATVMVVAGGILLLVHPLVPHPDGYAFLDVTWLALLEPFVTVAIAWLALAATLPRARIVLTAAAATYAVISIVAAVPALTEGDSPPAFLTALLGNGLVVAGVLSREWRLRSHP